MDCQDWVCGNCAKVHHTSCRTQKVKEALKEMQQVEAKKLQDILDNRTTHDQGMKKLQNILQEGLKSIKKDIQELQTNLRNKIHDLKQLEEFNQNFLVQEKRRKEFWKSLENSAYITSEITTIEEFEKAQASTKINVLDLKQYKHCWKLPKIICSFLNMEVGIYPIIMIVLIQRSH